MYISNLQFAPVKSWFLNFKTCICLGLNFQISNETLGSGLGLDNNLIRREGSLFCHRHKARSSPCPSFICTRRIHHNFWGEATVGLWSQGTIWGHCHHMNGSHIIIFRRKWKKWNHPGVMTRRKEAKKAKLNNKQLLAENKRFLCVFLGWESLASLRLLSVFLRPLKVELFSSSRAPITHCYKRFLSSTSQNLNDWVTKHLPSPLFFLSSNLLRVITN